MLTECVCPGCGYDLTGVPAGACPECGRAFTLDQALREGVRRRDAWLDMRGETRLVLRLWGAMLVSLVALAAFEPGSLGLLGAGSALAGTGLVMAWGQRNWVEHAIEGGQGGMPGARLLSCVRTHTLVVCFVALPCVTMVGVLIIGALGVSLFGGW